MKRLFLSLCIAATILPAHAERDPIRLTHGPMLGHVTASSIRVWGRTSDAGEFQVSYGTDSGDLSQMSKSATTRIEDDNTGSITVTGLKPDTHYYYQLRVNNLPHGLPGSFRTMPSAAESKNAEHNPKGLFQYYDGRTGELDYAEAISIDRE